MKWTWVSQMPLRGRNLHVTWRVFSTMSQIQSLLSIVQKYTRLDYLFNGYSMWITNFSNALVYITILIDTFKDMCRPLNKWMFSSTAEYLYNYIKTLQQYFSENKLPVLIVGTKADQTAVMQDYELQPVQFCHKHKLPPPQMYTCVDRINKDVYVKLTTMAAYP